MNNYFFKYPSLLGNHLMKSELRYSDEILNKKGYATEKLHGTNVGIYVFPDGKILYATRTELKTLDELTSSNIHDGLQYIIDEKSFIKKGLELIEKHCFEYVVFYGELFGKGIFNMDYIQVKNNIKSFNIFSIIGVLETITNEEKILKKLSLNELLSIFNENELVPLELFGTLIELFEKCDLNNDSNYGGIREGFVIQPVEELIFNSLDKYPLEAIKLKSTNFIEVTQVNKLTEQKINGINLINLSLIDKELILKVMEFINIARLENVISHGKIEPVIQKIEILTLELINDAIEEGQFEINSRCLGALKSLTLPLVKEYLLNHNN